MAWCPICKNEYRPGIKVCADCGATLVDSLEESSKKILIRGDKEILARLDEFMEAGGVSSGEIVPSEQEDTLDYLVSEEDFQRASSMFQVFMNEHTNQLKQKAMEQAIANASPEEAEAIKKMAQASMTTGNRQRHQVYESSTKKMEENKASAWSLFLIGGLGIIAIVLCLTGIIPLPNFFKGAYLFFGVMGALCVLFLVMGFVSFRSAKGFAKDAESENTLKASLETWCKENLRGADIDRYIKMRDPSLEGESLFFPRNELIKARINHQFMNLDQDFLDRFVDDVVYEMVFPEDKE